MNLSELIPQGFFVFIGASPQPHHFLLHIATNIITEKVTDVKYEWLRDQIDKFLK